jgi:hypothetical protein
MAVSAPIILAQNILELGTPTATDTDADTAYSVLHLTDRRTYTYWLGASAGTKYVTIDCGTPVPADALGIIGHNLYTATATVSVEWSADGVSWTEALAGFTPTSDKAFLKTFTAATKRYWRLKIVTASIAAKIAVVFLGSRVTFPRTWSHPSRGAFDPLPEKIVASSVRSKAGNLLGSVLQYASISMTMEIELLTDTWISGTFRTLWDTYLSQLYPVFVSWDPGDHPAEVLFGKIPDDFELSRPWTQNAYRSLSLEFEGVKE